MRITADSLIGARKVIVCLSLVIDVKPEISYSATVQQGHASYLLLVSKLCMP